MQHLTFTRSLLFACLLVPACGDDKGDDSGSTSMTSAATPATPGTSDTTTTNPTNATDATSEPTTTPTTDGPTSNPTSETATDATTDPTGAPTGTFCQEECTADEDCKLMGADLNFKCNADGRCDSKCADDNACVKLYSGWITPCTDQTGCPGQACVDIGGGEGKCASVPNEMAMLTCADFMLGEVMLPLIEGGPPVTVCANTDYTCNADGVCTNPCESDQECLVAPLTQCDMGTGACRCADDAGCMAANPNTPKCTDAGYCGCADDTNCAATPNTPVCTANGFCGCAEDANCTAAMTGDKCFEGACGCSDSTACPAKTSFDGTKFVCEGF